MLHSYATLAQLRARQGDGATDTSNDVKYLAKLRRASALIDAETGRLFQPMNAARTFDYENSRWLLWHGFDLLSLTSVTNGDGSTVDSTAIKLLGPGPYFGVDVDGTLAYLSYSTTTVQALTVAGVWGWHDDYANAWHATGQTVQDTGGISASAATITVTSTAGADSWGISPCVSAGNLIQVESEWMQVVTTTATTLTVMRAQNGTTAAAHAKDTAISVYEAPADIQETCLLWAAYLVAQDSTDLGKIAIDPMGGKTVPMGKPKSIVDNLAPYCRVRVA
jgi:hypothetical protein